MDSADRPRGGLIDGIVAISAAIAAIAGSYAVTGYTSAFVVAPVTALVTRLTPGVVIAWTITTLGDLGQLVAVGTALTLTGLGLSLLTYAGLVVGRAVASRTVGGILAGVGIATATYLIAMAAIPALVAGATAGLVVALAGGEATGRPPVSSPRRKVLTAVGAASITAVAGLGLAQRDDETESAAPVDDPVVSDMLDTADTRSLDIDGLDPLRSGGHYVVDVANPDPDLDAVSWSLSLTGAVDAEQTYTYEDLQAAPTEHRFVTLRCVGDPLNGKKIDTALWTGTPVMDLLPDDLPAECCVMLRAADDFYEEFPLSALEDALLATRMNGRPIPRGHGHPVRALVPGHWGEINVKWLTEIEILADPADGYWEKRGWHGTGPVATVAKLHAVRTDEADTVTVAGHAYAGVRGIDRVEVSTDGGETWSEATLSDRLPGARTADGTQLRETAQDAWRMWRHTYEATEPHEVVVRAIDGTGTRQDAERAEPYPRGASGWVSTTVDP